MAHSLVKDQSFGASSSLDKLVPCPRKILVTEAPVLSSQRLGHWLCSNDSGLVSSPTVLAGPPYRFDKHLTAAYGPPPKRPSQLALPGNALRPRLFCLHKSSCPSSRPMQALGATTHAPFTRLPPRRRPILHTNLCPLLSPSPFPFLPFPFLPSSTTIPSHDEAVAHLGRVVLVPSVLPVVLLPLLLPLPLARLLLLLRDPPAGLGILVLHVILRQLLHLTA